MTDMVMEIQNASGYGKADLQLEPPKADVILKVGNVPESRNSQLR
jgi:hypothetical protein